MRFGYKFQKTVLPNTAIEQIPKVLSERRKTKLSKIEPKEAAQLLNKAVELINHGSVKSITELLCDRLVAFLTTA